MGSITPIAPRVKSQPQIAGYIRLTRRRYGGANGIVEEAVWVKGADVQLVEAHYADQTDKLIGTTITLHGGARVYATQSVDAVMALLSDLEGASRG